MSIAFKDDLTNTEGLEDGVFGRMVTGQNGYRRAVLTDASREALRIAFKEQIATAVKDHANLDKTREANLRAYEAQHDPGAAITIPNVKRDTNQQFAWLLDAVFTKDPTFTVRALDNDPVAILVESEPGRPEEIALPADEYARQLEAALNFYTKHRIGFKKVFRTWVFEMLRDGSRPPILKVLHDDRVVEYGGLNIVKDKDERIVKIERDPVYRTVKDGQAVRIENVPGEKFFVPFPWDDIQAAPFVFQEFEESLAKVKDKIARRIYDFCRPDDVAPDSVDIAMVLSGSSNRDQAEKWRADGRRPSAPLKDIRLYELWFDCPFPEFVAGEPEIPDAIDPTTFEVIPGTPATEGRIETTMIPMCAVVHAESGIWLNCYENHRWDRMRPFFAGRMQDRPFSFSGYSTAENVAPFQRLITQLFNARLQNIAVANVQTLGVREGSTSWRFFVANKGQLRPGTIWPFSDPSDVKSELLGRNVESTAPEINYLNAESEKMSTVYDYDRGQIPNRTPVGTVEAVDSLAKMQPRMVLDQIRDTTAEVLECLVRTLAQFYPGGIRVPYRDPNTSDLVEVKVVGFPREWRDGIFTFDIAATGNEETIQSLTMRDLNLSQEVTKFNGEWMQTIAASMTPNPQNGMLPPPPLMVAATQMIVGKRNMLARVFHHNKLNPDEYLPTEKMIRELPLRLMDFQRLAQMAQAMTPPQPMMEGGMGELPEESGGAVPAEQGGGPPVAVMEGEPSDGGVAQGAMPPPV
jgi:hypothetical protein